MLWPLLGLALVGGVEAFRTKTRRGLVEEWAHSRGWTLQVVRRSFEPFGPTWLTYYWIEATDPQGRDHRGLVYATGFLRRKVDWSQLWKRA